ncbi:hypothetical protein QBC33DRAFT_433326, partial [Phialemonium atrogriseum]
TPPRREQASKTPRSALQPLQEYHSGFSDVDIGFSAPRPSHHRRQQSFPNLFPNVLGHRTPSPTGKTLRFAEEMPYTGDWRPGKAESPRGGLAGWLGGKASAGALGVADPWQPNPDTTPTRLRKSQPASGDSPTPKNTVTSTASRFISAISRFTQAPASPTLDDELCNFDIEAALYPPGSPTDRDAFSPAAFKNLQTNATGLLSKMQNAYRQRVIAVRDLEAEKAAQKDELEEAETRAAHLKMQLEGMALRAAEQEKGMQQLMDQLMAEKKARAEEKLAREKSIALMAGGPMVSEDMGVDVDQLRRTWRKSGDTVKTDTSFESDDESAASESVFSRSRSPTIPPSTVDGSIMDAPSSQARGSTLSPPKQKPGQQMSTFQKIIKGISGDADENGVNGCQNCKGQDASVAWDTVSVLRDENKHLKQRVGQLEAAVEGALDLVNGIGL